ncbi:MAG: ATP-binding cassette domain-containing protein, partial [Deltaproteobacteria bacterium]|nr:ATP-binding cassette domain-containing protein [Deltaproteobacteria bacterium]
MRKDMSVTTAKPLLAVRNLTVYYGENQALVRVSLSVCREQITSIVGPNGSGKTTFMK